MAKNQWPRPWPLILPVGLVSIIALGLEAVQVKIGLKPTAVRGACARQKKA
jgi:hypothetical protein